MDLNLPSEKQFDIWRKMSIEEKYELFLDLMKTTRALKAAGVKMQHPDWDQETVDKAVAKIYIHAGS